jgi:hypothetical protein
LKGNFQARAEYIFSLLSRLKRTLGLLALGSELSIIASLFARSFILKLAFFLSTLHTTFYRTGSGKRGRQANGKSELEKEMQHARPSQSMKKLALIATGTHFL